MLEGRDPTRARRGARKGPVQARLCYRSYKPSCHGCYTSKIASLHRGVDRLILGLFHFDKGARSVDGALPFQKDGYIRGMSNRGDSVDI